MARAEPVAIAAITAVAALLRFATLDVQGFWLDESVTVGLVAMPFSELLGEIPDSESTPPLYYVLAWVWAKAFGMGEVGLRSLSALCGTVAVPVAWAAARELASARVAIAVAALAAVSPFLVWYSQEARSYALLMLLGALSLWLLARLVRSGRRRDLALWALVCALALATHYFAVFLVAAEALWLVAAAPSRRAALAAVGAVSAAGIALLPLALAQESAGLASYIGDEPLGRRAAQTVKQLALGFDSPIEPVTAGLVAVVLAAGVLGGLARADPADRRGVRVAGTLGAAALGLPLVLALAGVDYVLSRNVILAWLPLTIVAAAGLTSVAAGRAGRGALVAVAVLALTSSAGVALEPGWQREDWRGAAAAIGDRPVPRAILVSEPAHARAVALYRPRARPLAAGSHEVAEVVALARRGRNLGDALPAPPDPAAMAALGVEIVDVRREASYELVRLAPQGPAVRLSVADLMALRLARERGPTAVLVEP